MTSGKKKDMEAMAKPPLRSLITTALLGASLSLGCATAPVKRIEVVPPANLDGDGIMVCVFKRDARLLRCMDPVEAYLMLSDGTEIYKQDGGTVQKRGAK